MDPLQSDLILHYAQDWIRTVELVEAFSSMWKSLGMRDLGIRVPKLCFWFQDSKN